MSELSQSALDALEMFGKALGQRLDTLNGPPDAIDVENARAPRTSAVQSIRDAPEMEQFRQALVDGLIANDAARQALELATAVLTRLWVIP